VRLGEALLVRAAEAGNAQAEAEALGAAVDFNDISLAVRFAAPECEGVATSPVVLMRQCDDAHVDVVFATEPRQHDTLWMTPTQPPESGEASSDPAAPDAVSPTPLP
jgi:hypothetical protein